MKCIKNIMLAASIALASLGMSFSANADLVRISQSVESEYFGGSIASFVFEFDYALLNTGLIDTAFLEVSDYSLVYLEVFGLPDFFLNINDFQAVVDTDNIDAGLEFLYFEVDDQPYSDLFSLDAWAYQLEVDSFEPDFNLFDIFELDSAAFVDFDSGTSLSFGDASISYVSAPSVLALFGLSLVFVGIRRRTS